MLDTHALEHHGEVEFALLGDDLSRFCVDVAADSAVRVQFDDVQVGEGLVIAVTGVNTVAGDALQDLPFLEKRFRILNRYLVEKPLHPVLGRRSQADIHPEADAAEHECQREYGGADA